MHQDDDNSEHRRLPDPFSGPSKSHRKREATALQRIGEKLVNLTPAQLGRIPLPAELREAIDAAQTLSQRGARKRQLQYIGKLMRRIDPLPISAALEALESSNAASKREHHYLETLCAALIAGDEASLGAFLADHPSADRQHLRQLMRNAAREQSLDSPSRHRRALFRYLREQLHKGGS